MIYNEKDIDKIYSHLRNKGYEISFTKLKKLWNNIKKSGILKDYEEEIIKNREKLEKEYP